MYLSLIIDSLLFEFFSIQDLRLNTFEGLKICLTIIVIEKDKALKVKWSL